MIGEKSKALLLEDTKEILNNFISSFPMDGGIELTDHAVEETMNNILINNKRSLYNFFDKNKIYMTLTFTDKGYFEYVIDSIKSEKFFNTRIEAEEAGFDHCFDILEKNIL